MQSWGDLEPAWHEAFQLAWEAYGAGTIPVGAVVTDADGSVIALGRNRMFAVDAPRGQIFGSRVAHAEINALVQLGTERRYHDCALWTTLEPCAQCIGAAWLSTIGCVVFAATDVYGGASKLIERQIEAADSARNFPMAVVGPLDGPLAVFSELLHIAFFHAQHPEHHVMQTFRERRPAFVALAERLRLGERAGAPLDDVLPSIWDDLGVSETEGETHEADASRHARTGDNQVGDEPRQTHRRLLQSPKPS